MQTTNKRQADTDDEHAEQRERRVGARGRRAVLHRDRQQRERDEQQAELHERLPPDGHHADRQMRECVAGKQDGLEEDERDGPHGRRPAEQRQEHLPDHRLDEEHERRADEDRAAEERERTARDPCSPPQEAARYNRGLRLHRQSIDPVRREL